MFPSISIESMSGNVAIIKRASINVLQVTSHDAVAFNFSSSSGVRVFN